MTESKPELGQNINDWIASSARGVLGVIPLIGPIFGEIVSNLIPAQRIERMERFLKCLEEDLSKTKEKLESFYSNISTSQGIELFEDCLILASRASTDIRKQRLARLTFSSITCDPINYSEAKKMVNLYSELTDEELITLVYHREPSYQGLANKPEDYHTIMRNKYPEILNPISATLGQDEKVYRRLALQDSYKSTLIQKGLCKTDHSLSITPLGKILAEYISLDDENTRDD